MNHLVQLRELLAQRFPQTRLGVARGPDFAMRPTGVAAFDALGGGLPCGELTELVAPDPGSGSAQMLHAMLRGIAAAGQFMALVDAADSFDASAVEAGALARLLWVRCGKVDEALQATDLLLRDRNFSLVALDFKMNSAAQLRKISSSVWHRFGRLIEHHDAAVLVITPFQLVNGAACRVRLESALDLAALTQGPAEVAAQLHFELMRPARTSDPGEATAKAG